MRCFIERGDFKGSKRNLDSHMEAQLSLPNRLTNKRLVVTRTGLLRDLLPYLFVSVGAGVGTIAAGAVGAAAGTGGGTAAAVTSPIERIDKERLEKLKRTSPEQILKSDKKNFDVTYSDIVKIQVGKKLLTSRAHIHTLGLVHKFKFEGLNPEKVENSIRSLLADKIHIERVDKLE
jgi:pantothenate kinase